MNERKHYLDNIRWITLCVVILYHVFYIFNSSGVISNINAPGIKAFDSICVFTEFQNTLKRHPRRITFPAGMPLYFCLYFSQ